MDNNNSNISPEEEKIPTVYINPDGTGTIDFTGCKGYLISSLDEAVAVLNDLYMKGDFESALCLLKLAFDLARKSDQSSEEFRRALTKLYGLAGDISAEYGDTKSALEYYKSFQCLKMQLKNNLFRDTTPSETIKLYQFRKFSNYSLANLLNKEVTLSSPKIMNDVFDSLIFQWLNSPSYGLTAVHKKHLEPYKKSFDDYRIACFCEDNLDKGQFAIQNNLMWSHYADEHQGFCIEYLFSSDDFRRDEFNNITASRLFRMNYINPSSDKPIDFQNINNESSFNSAIAFLTKHKDWSYENEVRLLQYQPKDATNHVQYRLSEKTVINAIYFGYRCPEANIQVIKELMSGRNIKFYKMEIDYSNIYQLNFIEI